MSVDNSNVAIKTILVGIDGSEYSLGALEFAIGVAKKYDPLIIAFTVSTSQRFTRFFKIKRIIMPFQSKTKLQDQRICSILLKRKDTKIKLKYIRNLLIPV